MLAPMLVPVLLFVHSRLVSIGTLVLRHLAMDPSRIQHEVERYGIAPSVLALSRHCPLASRDHPDPEVRGFYSNLNERSRRLAVEQERGGTVAEVLVRLGPD